MKLAPEENEFQRQLRLLRQGGPDPVSDENQKPGEEEPQEGNQGQGQLRQADCLPEVGPSER